MIQGCFKNHHTTDNDEIQHTETKYTLHYYLIHKWAAHFVNCDPGTVFWAQALQCGV